MSDGDSAIPNKPIKSAAAGQPYEVGYKKPPRQHSWGPGQCGNPKNKRRKKAAAVPRGQKARLKVALEFHEALDTFLLLPAAKLKSIDPSMTGAQVLALMIARDAMAKDGPSRRAMMGRYTPELADAARDAEMLGQLTGGADDLRYISPTDPRITDAQFERLMGAIEANEVAYFGLGQFKPRNTTDPTGA